MSRRHAYDEGPLTVVGIIILVIVLAILGGWAIGQGLAHLVIA